MASSEFHNELKSELDRAWVGYGMSQQAVVFGRDKVNDLLAEHASAVEEAAHLEALGRGLEENLKRAGEEIERLRGKLAGRDLHHLSAQDPEPPLGSVVCDGSNVAWVRTGDSAERGLWSTRDGFSATQDCWWQVVCERGGVLLVSRPQAPTDLLSVENLLFETRIWLDSSGLEPPYGSIVEEGDGTRWVRTGDGPAGWEAYGIDHFEPESWTRVCENGAVRLLQWGEAE